ncbi:glycosyltransferase family 4 protein [Woodsholea maritima]|uniref:glycosyltransferase family 4 protein n=1 Tax=Woodsholea maritima TaxID=240237 RepID=UPI00036041DB|nr:glycosyltransferase family 1 protein [Woodsholea maritima]
MDDGAPLRIMLITDAWEPQVNGVVRTLTRTAQECREMGHEVEVIHPGLGYRTIPLPTYPEIKLALGAKKDIEARFKAFEPEAIHIATEGTLGQAARSICLKWKLPFTTSYHTKFPEYVNARFPFIPLSFGYSFMRRFHNSGNRLMVATPSMRDDLEKRGFNNITPWARGVDTDLFHPDKRGIDGGVYKGMEGPISLYVGRIAVEKNLEAFLKTDIPGTKVLVGPGPQFDELKARYPEAHFVGSKSGEELARYFADADIFVFPSLTDTFGLVILEAMATGTPVAAFPAPGPKDLIPGSNAGWVSEDLREACLKALEMKREDCRTYAEGFSWRSCAEEFVRNLKPQPRPERKRFWRRLRRLGRTG